MFFDKLGNLNNYNLFGIFGLRIRNALKRTVFPASMKDIATFRVRARPFLFLYSFYTFYPLNPSSH